MTITLRELAGLAGVSVGTASQALRGVGTTSRETSERIRALADVHGYQADPLMSEAGRRHRAGRRGRVQTSIGVLNCRTSEMRQAFPQARFRTECEAAIASAGSESLYEEVSDFKQLQQTIRIWFHRGVRGVILLNMMMPSWFDEINWEQMAVVFLGKYSSQIPLNTILLDYPKGMELALNHAIEMNQRIGVVLAEHLPFEVLDDSLRAGVLRSFLQHYPSHFVEPLYIPFAECGTAVPAWYEAQRPELVVSVAAVRAWLPEHLPFIYYIADRSEVGRMGVIERQFEVAKVTVNLLADMIWRGEVGRPDFPNTIRIAPEWFDRRLEDVQ